MLTVSSLCVLFAAAQSQIDSASACETYDNDEAGCKAQGLRCVYSDNDNTCLSECKFRLAPKSARVSNNPGTAFKIRFKLKSFLGNFCRLRVKFPSDKEVTFKLPNKNNKKANFAYEDADSNIVDKVHITKYRTTLVIVGVNEEFGSRFGKYVLNDKEVYGVDYSEYVVGPLGQVSGATCTNENTTMSGKVSTTEAFQRCVDYNDEKNDEKEIFKKTYLVGDSFIEYRNKQISFNVENVGGTVQEHSVTCQITTDDGGVSEDYVTRFVSHHFFCMTCV